MEVPRKITKRLSDVVLDLFNTEIGLNSIWCGWFKILKGILGDIPDVGWVPKSPARGIVRNHNSYLSSGSTNSIDLFHKSHEVSNMLDDVAQIHNVYCTGLQR